MSERGPADGNVNDNLSRASAAPTTRRVTIGSRRDRNANTRSATSDNIPLTTATPQNEAPEPFPILSPTPGISRTNTAQEYFPQPPVQYRMTPRSIGLRRLGSANVVNQARPNSAGVETSGSLRRRGNTAPSRQRPEESISTATNSAAGRYDVASSPPPQQQQQQQQPGMETIAEGEQSNHAPHRDSVDSAGMAGGIARRTSRRLRGLSDATRSAIGRMSDERDRPRQAQGNDYEDSVVDYLDVLDPEVSTLTTLTNVQNSLFIPDIPILNRFINRRPTYNLTKAPSKVSEGTEGSLTPVITRQTTRKPLPPEPAPEPVPPKSEEQEERILEKGSSKTPELPTFPHTHNATESELARRASITSVVNEEHYAVLPHGVTLEGWSQEDVDMLDDYVRHMLHSRRNRFKRSMKGFGKYIRRPLGFFVTLYATLITVFGLIWVLFLIGWISLGERKDYIVNIIDNVLVALFAIMGDGLAPFRVIDTYHMIFIAHYHRLSWRIRKQRGLSKLADHNDLPEQTPQELGLDIEDGSLEKHESEDWHFSVLTPQQQKKLIHHQTKFSKSHSYYRPHETTTHHAFPLKLLITIVSLLDAHSVLQIMLGAFTWGWSYHTRPGWITAVILSFSITVNITAGVLISVGDKKTRKKDVLLRMARQGLTEEAMRKLVKKKKEQNRHSDVRRLVPATKKASEVNQEIHTAVAIENGVLRQNSSGSSTNELVEKLTPYKESLVDGVRMESYRTARTEFTDAEEGVAGRSQALRTA